jgi:Ni/Co efflux regulator RcnB
MNRTNRFAVLALASFCLLAPSLASAGPDDRGRSAPSDYRHRDRDYGEAGRRFGAFRTWDYPHRADDFDLNRWGHGPEPRYGRHKPHPWAWSRGQVLPPSYPYALIGDYGHYRLRPPPRGLA